MKELVDEDHSDAAGKLRENLATYSESKDLIDVGAYQQGSNPLVDQAVRLNQPIKGFLKQKTSESFSFDETVPLLKAVLANQPIR